MASLDGHELRRGAELYPPRDAVDGQGGYGRIVTVISDAGRVGEPHLAVYSVPRREPRALCGPLQGRWPVRDHRELRRPRRNTHAGGRRSDPDAETEKRAPRNMIRRLGEPEDPAGMILFLCSYAASCDHRTDLSGEWGYSFAC